jgi:hypothetical protein
LDLRFRAQLLKEGNVKFDDDNATDKITASAKGSRGGGPRTPAGRRRARMNAVKTGIFAKIVLAGEPFRERESDFQELLAELRKALRPLDFFEGVLVENLAMQLLRLTRFYEADAATAPVLFRIVREKIASDVFDARPPSLPREEPFVSGKLPAADLLLRYETGIWRQIDRILERLDHWRRMRDGRGSSDNGASK